MYAAFKVRSFIADALLDVHYVDVSVYAEKPVSTIKSLFKYWFDKAAWHKPSILILDNVEHLLKAEEEVRHSAFTQTTSETHRLLIAH